MDADRFDSIARSIDARSRRRLLGTLSGAVALGPLALLSDAKKGKKKRKKKKKKKQEQVTLCVNGQSLTVPRSVALSLLAQGATFGACSPPSPPAPTPTCEETCPSNCTECYIRPGATTMCGESNSTSCVYPCASDTDCIGTMRPYCVSQQVDRDTGAVIVFCRDFTTPGGFCTSIVACA